jgi:2-dehydro-3-deoxyphosphooctonate aldolase (KDO 8-P synthase)
MTGQANKIVSIGNVRFGNDLPLTLIAGPCQMESRDHAFQMAGALKEICKRVGIGLVYKTSFDKANRTALPTRCRSLPICAPNSTCRC